MNTDIILNSKGLLNHVIKYDGYSWGIEIGPQYNLDQFVVFWRKQSHTDVEFKFLCDVEFEFLVRIIRI